MSARTGAVFAVTEVKTTLECVLSHCQSLVTTASRVVAPNFRFDSINGYALVSRNGRYALLTAGDSQTLLDLSTGAARSTKGSPTALRQAVADDGSLLLRGSTPREILLQRDNGDSRFSTAQDYDEAKIDSQASRIVYSSNATSNGISHWTLHAINTATGQDTTLADADLQGMPAQIWISGNGQQIVYLAQQVFFVRGDGTGKRQLTLANAYPEGFIETTISSDGAYAYAISRWNRVIQIDLSSGAIAEIIPRTPILSNYGPALVPGSMGILYGSALSDQLSVLPRARCRYRLVGVSIKIGDLDAPIPYGGTGLRFVLRFPSKRPLGRIDFIFPAPLLFSRTRSSLLTLCNWMTGIFRFWI